MNNIFESGIVGVTLTFVIYFGASVLYQKFRWVLLHPVLLSIVGIILILKLLNIDYGHYNRGGQFITFFLKPAVVALGVPLYMQLEEIRKQKWAIILSQIAGAVTGILLTVLFAWLFKISHVSFLSLIPKSVTTPIAVEISAAIGGIPPLTVGIVVAVGLQGALLGVGWMRWAGITDRAAMGLAMGAASHALGTARMGEIGSVETAHAGLSIILTGIVTALFAPWVAGFLF